MKKIKCSLCGSSKYKLKYKITKNNFSFNIVRCLDCGMTYLNPQPSEADIKNMYNEDYFHGHGFDKGVDYVKGLDIKDLRDMLHEDRLRNIRRFVAGHNILDIGCGLGEFLDVAKKRDWNANGIELSEYSANIARKRFKLNIRIGVLEKTKYPKNFFDAITMVEVIEHLHSPMVTLRKCHQILNKEGVVVIQTGNIDSLYARLKGKNWPYYLAGHLNYFSKRTLTEMLEKCGFEVIAVYNGDEISLAVKSRSALMLRKKNYVNWNDYAKYIAIECIRKMGFGGMTIYARKK